MPDASPTARCPARPSRLRPEPARHHRRRARRGARRDRSRSTPVRRHSARGGHSGRLGRWAVRRLPPGARRPAPAAGLHPERGTEHRDGRAGRPPRGRRPRRPGRSGARSAAAVPARGDLCPGRHGPTRRGRRTRPERGPTRSGHHGRARPGLRGRPPRGGRLSHRGRHRAGQRRGRPVVGAGAPRPLVPPVPQRRERRRAHVSRRPRDLGGHARRAGVPAPR